MARTRRCRKACAAWRASCAARVSSRGVWPRSASSRPRTDAGCRLCSRPASALSARKARCGAGTVLPRAPMHRPLPRSAWPRRTGSPNSTRKWRLRRRRCAPPKPPLPRRKTRCASVSPARAPRGRPGATASGCSAMPAMRWRGRRRRPANLPAGATSWRNRAPASPTILPKPTAAVADAETQLAGCARSRRSQRPAGSACRRRSPAIAACWPMRARSMRA